MEDHAGTTRFSARTNAGITPEQVRDIRACAWSFAFRCWQEKTAAQAPEPDAAAKVKYEEEVSHVKQ